MEKQETLIDFITGEPATELVEFFRKEIEKPEKPYEFGEQKYSSKSSEYKTFDKIQTENLQSPIGIEKGIAHMGIEQSTKRKSQKFIDDKSEKEYKNFMYDKFE